MFSLKSKLIAGFASLLAVAIIVSVVGITVINSYSDALQRVLRENYDSMVYLRRHAVRIGAHECGLPGSPLE